MIYAIDAAIVPSIKVSKIISIEFNLSYILLNIPIDKNVNRDIIIVIIKIYL